MIQKKGLGRGLSSLIPKKVSPSLVKEENKEILKDIGWEQFEPHAWKIEWWD